MPDEKKDEIQIRRNAVVLNSCGIPAVYSAQEAVSWKGGNVALIGLGASRADALAAVDVQFENLKKILGVL